MRSIFCAAIFLALTSANSFAQEIRKPAAAANTGAAAVSTKVPPAEDLLILLRDALAALNQANRTGNYTVLQAMGSPEFQQKNSAATLSAVFTPLREKGISLYPTLIVTPQLTVPPLIGADGTLRLEGNFATKPYQLNFIAIFQAPDWRLAGLSVSAAQIAEPPKAPEAKKPAASSGAKPAEKKK